MDLQQIQKEIFQNKVAHHFNVTNVEKEFLFLYGEVAEAFEAYKKKTNLEEELADVAIYLLGLAEITGVDLERAITKKMAINQKRQYKETLHGYKERSKSEPQ